VAFHTSKLPGSYPPDDTICGGGHVMPGHLTQTIVTLHCRVAF